MECRPIISTAMLMVTKSPSSFTVSKSKNRMRSLPNWRTATSFAVLKCLRSSMQNMGGVLGFSKEIFVKWMRGLLAEALIKSLTLPPRNRRPITISSLEGW